ncbi:hypothetical protein FXW78_20450 [Rhodococcus opacus]|nr:hypothetical protein [Rhodococcus opacus]
MCSRRGPAGDGPTDHRCGASELSRPDDRDPRPDRAFHQLCADHAGGAGSSGHRHRHLPRRTLLHRRGDRRGDAARWGDVDPTLYGHTEYVDNLYGVDRGTDERTLSAIDLGLKLEAPMLGICRGSQMINLACGGTLIPDLGRTIRTGAGRGSRCSSTTR